VQRDGGPVSYVFGTIHSTDARLRDLPAEVRQALEASSDTAFELVDDPAGQELLTQAMQLPPGRRLEDILGPELFGRAAAAAANLGVPADNLQSLKPWALSVFLVYPPVEVMRLFKGEPPFDSWLQAEARRLGKAVHGLETYQEQIRIFDGMSEAEQVAMVTDMVVDYDHIDRQFNRIFRAYLKGDLSVAVEEASDVSGVSDAVAAARFKERLIDERNRIMAQRMQPLLRGGRAFVAVGAAHLPGDGGVLDLLQDWGYVVTRAY
jgi:hypothetical protein